MIKRIRLLLVLLGGVLFICVASASSECSTVRGDALLASSSQESITSNEGAESHNQAIRGAYISAVLKLMEAKPEPTPSPKPAPEVKVLANISYEKKGDTYQYSEEDRYQYSEEEKTYIARVVYAEARGEIFEGQVAVATVVLNRFESGQFGSSVKKVVFARSQFAVSKRHNEEGMSAVEAAIERKGDYPENMYYFQASKSKKWRNFEYLTRIGGHSFYCAAE